MEFICIFVITLISLIVYNYFRWRKWKLTLLERNGIKGPKPNFIYGNTLEMLKNGNVISVGKWLKEFGPIVGYYVGRLPMIIVADLDLLKKVQIKEFKHFSGRFKPLKDANNADPRNRDMLIRVKNGKWKEMRTIIRQAFTASKLKSSIGIMDDTVNGFIASIDKFVDEGTQEFDIYPLFQGLTLETIGRSAFGITTDAQTNPNDPFLLASKAFFNNNLTSHLLSTLSICFPEFEIVLYPLRRITGILFPGHYGYLMGMSAAIVQARKSNENLRRKDLLQAMLDAKVNVKDLYSVDENSLTINTDMNAGEKDETKVVDDKEMSYKKMTVNEVVANTTLFFEAGYETTSTSLAFVMHILVNHIDVQEKVREEIIQLLKKDGKLDYNTTSNLPFMDAVINETLRIYPPITFFITRVADIDYKYKNITIPKGTSLIVPVYQIQHDETIWSEPEKFDPYRFFGENKQRINDLAWQPFGAGPRNCVGMRFAICEMKLAIAKLLSKYRFESGPRTEIGEITVKYKGIVMCPENVYVKAIRV
ncbi:cytochrome P450 3A8-like protein [Leptotrombidium deliense]|uniref:Cytochrome P450 3A8-like protein n=1 Tax=Leptotrombidium deliense TaxID=299467 RepID=A0A443S3D9_9ACAR|nr:cytochrome P450 3A8-like protein [Leptotrombidium deliense]